MSLFYSSTTFIAAALISFLGSILPFHPPFFPGGFQSKNYGLCRKGDSMYDVRIREGTQKSDKLKVGFVILYI